MSLVRYHLLLMPLVLGLTACGAAPDEPVSRSAAPTVAHTSPMFTPAPAVTPDAAAAAPSVLLDADALDIVEGGSVRLEWDSADALLCNASGSWGGPRPLQGSETLMPPLGEHRYVLECLGHGGVARDELVLRVGKLPVAVATPEQEFNRVRELEQGCCEATE